MVFLLSRRHTLHPLLCITFIQKQFKLQHSWGSCCKWKEAYSRTLFCCERRLSIEPASEKRLAVGLCFVKKTTNRACEWGETYGRTLLSFCLLRRLPIGLASERRITVGLVLFLNRLTVGLFVKKTTNRACKWGETYGRTCFIFFLLFSWPTLGLKKILLHFSFLYLLLRSCVI